MFLIRKSRSQRNVVERAGADKSEPAWPSAPVHSNAQFSNSTKSCNTIPMDAVHILIREERSPTPRTRRHGQAAFTLIELIFIIACIVLLATLVPAFSRQRANAIHTRCLNNQKQIALALTMYGADHGDKLPSNERKVGGPSWPWDMPWKPGLIMETNGTKWQTWYCPMSGLSLRKDFGLWNYSLGNYRVVGYAMTFADTASLATTNWYPKIYQAPLFSHGFLPTPPPADRVLLADLTISQPGENNEANRAANRYVNIMGGFSEPFRTSYMKGPMPLGGNVAIWDGHVEWWKFENMHVRTVGTTSPVFWW
jgi:competence protein ComGC